MVDTVKPLAIIAESFRIGYEWAREQYDHRLWFWYSQKWQVRDADGRIEAQLVTDMEGLEGREFCSYVIVGNPDAKLVDFARAMVRP